MPSLWQWSATALAKAIRDRRVSSAEVVTAHLDRIRAVNASLNAITLVLEDTALEAAEAADKAVADGAELGPLHGVPFTTKENIDLVGAPTTHGVVGLKDSMPAHDAAVVAHLKAAGAIPIGRTNLPDFGARWHTDNDLHGPTLNPWDPTRTPGGSSGGEAAAIASGMSPLGIGNDQGGSLRYPAQCCGIASIRPSLGRVSRIATRIFDTQPTLYEQLASVNGPMARHVTDLRLALDILSQPDPDDPWWTPAPRLGRDMPIPIRVAVTTDPTGDDVDSEIAAAIGRAADVLSDAGYAVERADPPAIADAQKTIQQISDMEVLNFGEDVFAMMSDDGRTVLDRLLAETPPDLSVYVAAIGTRHRIARDWNRFLRDHPLVLGPISTHEPFPVGYDLAGTDELERFVRSIALTESCNLMGLPSVAVPVHVANGLPQGVQIIGPRFHDDLCLDAAEAVERAQGVLTPIDPRAHRGD